MHTISRELADTESHSDHVRAKSVRFLIDGSILVGGAVATTLSLTTFLQRSSILKGLTSNIAVRDAAASIFPVVLITQVLKGLAYPVNGIIMGALDWRFTMIAMWAANIVCVGMIHAFMRAGTMNLANIWWALAAFMGTQVVTGIARYESKTGVWRVLKAEKNR
jgi:Na+-driven multidrug efflux pump